jgi:uncharacterized protein (DUF58 family)
LRLQVPVPTGLGVKGILFYVVLLGAFFAAPYNNLFFLLLVFLSVLGIVNLLWSARSLAGVEGSLRDPGPRPAGAGVEVAGVIRARGRPRLGLCLRLRLDGIGIVEVPAGIVRGRTVARGHVPHLPRGIYPVRSAVVASEWPLGLTRVSRPVPAFDELVIYPAPTDLADARGGADNVSELLGVFGSRKGQLQPSHLREYRTGDEIRSVHWKASARRRSLVIKEWEGGNGHGIEMLLDRRCDPEDLERALSVIAAIALAARDDKVPLNFHTQELSATYGPGRRPWSELLRILAIAVALPADGPAPPPVSPEVLRLPAALGAGGGR